ncbi:hypothetical protein OROGR_017161 [Orobanche gracilis]
MARTKTCGRTRPTASTQKRKEVEREESSQDPRPSPPPPPPPPHQPPSPPPPPADSNSSSSSEDEKGSDHEMEREDDQDLTLLRSYRDHVAHQIWLGNERGLLNRCTNRAWPTAMPTLSFLPQPFVDAVINFGLAPLE